MARALKTALLAAVIAGVALATYVTVSGQTPARATQPAVTFAKDIAPIFQKSCEGCHRPGQMAPMSLVTYQDVRPWVRSIKQRVVDREMPPWGIDPHVGIQSFKNDPRCAATKSTPSSNGSTRARHWGILRTCRSRGSSTTRPGGTSVSRT